MKAASTRWRLLELQRQRRAIRSGIELLDRKREALLRALAERAAAASRERARVAAGLDAAETVLHEALVEIGSAAAWGAAAAQPSAGGLAAQEDAVIGVRVPRLLPALTPFCILYGPGGTCETLDMAATRYRELLPSVLTLAEEERARHNLERGLRRTIRTLNALKSLLLPSVDAEIHSVEGRLEEEEREEAIRCRAGHAGRCCE